MRTQRRVFEKLSETTKVELASERIELNKQKEIKQLFQKIYNNEASSVGFKRKIEQDFQKGQKELNKLAEENESFIKTLRSDVMDMRRILDEYGAEVPAEIQKMFDESSKLSIQVSRIGSIYS
jgi:hypothetical protein